MPAVTSEEGWRAAKPEKAPPSCPVKIVVFTVMLLIGLGISQAVPNWFEPDAYKTWQQVVKVCTMFCLSFIMISVGYEFDIDKSKLRGYGGDYCIAMTAAGFPWIFVAIWFVYVLPDPLPWDQALVAARFAAPTSAGILFSMLEAAGMKETWLFQKARILAIFDDLDTILLMVPLKVMIVGLKWELSIDLFFVIVLLGLSWCYLHQVKIPVSWKATLLYSAVVTTFCELVHVLTTYHIAAMDTVHLEVLLPAFAIGCVARSGHSASRHMVDLEQPPMAAPAKHVQEEERQSEDVGGDEVEPVSPGVTSVRSSAASTFDNGAELCEISNDSKDDTIPEHKLSADPHPIQRPPLSPNRRRKMALSRRMSVIIENDSLEESEKVGTAISAIFMVFVGLSMPSLIGGGAKGGSHRRLASSSSGGGGGSAEPLPAGELVGHVVVVSLLMIAGKMFPTLCYSSEANLRTRFALSLGMCPRGEVGAGVIVISLGFGIQGSAITIAVIALAINLVLSSGFIMAVKHLARESEAQVVPFDDAEHGPMKVHEGKVQVNNFLNQKEERLGSKEKGRIGSKDSLQVLDPPAMINNLID